MEELADIDRLLQDEGTNKNQNRISKEELNAELEKGYADLQAGRTKPLEQAIAEMHRDFNI